MFRLTRALLGAAPLALLILSGFSLALEGTVAARLGTIVPETEELYGAPGAPNEVWRPPSDWFLIARGVSLLHARSCDAAWLRQLAEGTNDAALLDACIEAWKQDIRAAPSAGDSWLSLATLLFSRDPEDPSAVGALRASFRVAPQEAWLWRDRLMLSIAVWDGLPPDVRAQARADLAQMIITKVRNWDFDISDTLHRLTADKNAAAIVSKMLDGLDPMLRKALDDHIRYYRSTQPAPQEK